MSAKVMVTTVVRIGYGCSVNVVVIDFTMQTHAVAAAEYINKESKPSCEQKAIVLRDSL